MRALRTILKDFDASFDELLIRNEEKTVHVHPYKNFMVSKWLKKSLKTLTKS